MLVAAITGGIGGLAGEMLNGNLAGTALDEAVWDMADLLNTDYESALSILTGVANGAVEGQDLESIALGALGGISKEMGQNMIKDFFGESVTVDDWFKDGASTIPTEAFEPVLEGIVDAAISGGMDAEDALQMAWGYFSQGGDVDFMLPGFTDMVNRWEIPGLDIDISKGDAWSYTTNEDGSIDITWNLPSVDVPDGGDWNIGDLCYDDEGNPGVLGERGICDVEIKIETPYNCEEKGAGWTWDNLVGECIPPIGSIPTPYDCEKKGAGWTWDNLAEKCIPPLQPIYCTEEQKEMGWSWDSAREECLPPFEFTPVKPDCLEGESWSELDNKCIPDVIECISGQEWSDIYGKCVDKIDDDVKIETPDTNCPEGWVSEDGHCVEIKVPDVDIPDVPEYGGGNAAAGHDFQRQGLFDYTNIDIYQGTPLEPWKDELNLVRGMLS